jgi:inosine-uridine nucleoside N-ribohydrolase
MYPDVIPKIKNLCIMGGNIRAGGNVSMCAEFNFWYDPEAAHITITESTCPVYILPWEPCSKACRAMPHKTWRIDILGAVSNEIVDVMNLIEENHHFQKNFNPCDAFLIACIFFPQILTETEKLYAAIELTGTHTRGEMIVDDRGLDIHKPNCFIIKDFNVESFKKLLLWVVGHDVDFQ